MTIEEVAAVLGLARSTAYDLAKADRLPVPVIRAGKRIFVSRALVERVLAGQPIWQGKGGDAASPVGEQDTERLA